MIVPLFGPWTASLPKASIESLTKAFEVELRPKQNQYNYSFTISNKSIGPQSARSWYSNSLVSTLITGYDSEPQVHCPIIPRYLGPTANWQINEDFVYQVLGDPYNLPF